MRIKGNTPNDSVKRKSVEVMVQENLYRQILNDLIRLCNLVALFALGDTSLEQERNQLEGATQIKLALLRGLEPTPPGSGPTPPVV